jgi:hypothetical protein
MNQIDLGVCTFVGCSHLITYNRGAKREHSTCSLLVLDRDLPSEVLNEGVLTQDDRELIRSVHPTCPFILEQVVGIETSA